MIYWLVQVLREMREARDVSLRDVQFLSSLHPRGIDIATFARFEDHRSVPRQLGLAVRCYAEALGEDPKDLWGYALARWRAEG